MIKQMDGDESPHCNDVSAMLRLVRIGMEKLEYWLQQDEAGRQQVEAEFKAFWGERENFLSALVKLAQLQMKLIPLEQALLSDDVHEGAEHSTMTEEDWDMLARAVERRHSNKKHVTD